MVAGAAGILAIVAFSASCLDPNFRRIAAEPDNIAIVIMLALLGFFLWLGLRRAAVNDGLLEAGSSLVEGTSQDRQLVWPHLVFPELIVLILCIALLLIWAIQIPAPLGEPADPDTAPNPAKAPWYFLGLQELLVYFDPWLAGVVVPSLIIFGLIAIPYLDRNPRGNGYYTLRERPFAIATFLLAFIVLWITPLIVGTFLRGPNWDFFGVFERWDPQRPVVLANVELHDLVWIHWLDRPLPSHALWRELPGLGLLAGYFLAGPLVLRPLFFRKVYAEIGFARYSVMSLLLLAMLLLPIKMIARWTLNLHHIVTFDEWLLSI
ncbi:MAG: cytochrome C [Planctomycetes bacterium]|nr:cytochrome C [Planctomycetota bacterium]